jgi:putative endonuclease
MTNVELGQLGEKLVLEKYLNDGYELLKQNFNYYESEKLGEIDIILIKGNRLYLVEVKTRTSEAFGDILSQITKKKLRCVYKSYLGFVKKNTKFQNYFVQFDVATVLGDKVDIYPNAVSFEGVF